jgi:uridine phosphorylase
MSPSESSSSESVKTSRGNLYHIDLAPGDLANSILLCVDPTRARGIAGYFDEVTLERSSREILTITGSFKGCPISVIGTGIGQDNEKSYLLRPYSFF